MVSSFYKKIVVLFGTQALSKIFPLLSSLFILYFYSAIDLGKFSVFTATATILAYGTTLAYEIPLLSSNTPSQLQTNFFACLYVICGLVGVQCFLCGGIYSFCYTEPFILYIPLYTFLRAFSFVIQNLALHFHYENRLSLLKVVDSFICNVALLGLGYANWQLSGLLISSFLSLLPSLIVPFWFLSGKINLKPPSYAHLILFYKKHMDLPRFIASGRLIENLNLHLHTVLFSSLFSMEAMGYLYFVQRILTAPLQLFDLLAQFILKGLYHTPHLQKIRHKIPSFVGILLVACTCSLPFIYSFLEFCLTSYISLDLLRIVEIVLPMYLLTYLYQTIVPFLILYHQHKSIFCCYLGGTLILLFVYMMGLFFKCDFFLLLCSLSFIKSLWFLVCLLRFYFQAKENRIKPEQKETFPPLFSSLSLAKE